MRLEPDVRWSVRSSHPVGKPMIKFSRGLVRIGGIALGPEDRIFFGICDAARAVSVRYTCKRRVHIARRQGRVRYGAKAAGLVDIDLATVLRGSHAHEQKQRKPFHGQFLTQLVIQREYQRRYVRPQPPMRINIRQARLGGSSFCKRSGPTEPSKFCRK